MEFFDELGKKAQAYAGVAADKAKDLAGAASEKAKTVVGTAKINMAIMMEQRELDKNYKAIGEWFVAEYAQEIPEAVKDVVEAVNASKAKIAELEAKLAGVGRNTSKGITEETLREVEERIGLL